MNRRLLLFTLVAVLVVPCVSVFAQSQNAASDSKEIAVTIDDVPLNGPRIDSERLRAMTSKILDGFQRHKIPVVGFVNESLLYVPGEADARIALLRLWANAGVELGNHTFAHLGFKDTPLSLYEDDFVRGDGITRTIMRESGRRPRYFRHPFLQMGPTLELEKSFESFIGDRGYRIAPITIGTMDWMILAVYSKARSTNDAAMLKQISDDYLKLASDEIDYGEKAAGELFGHPIKHILLLHANELNADNIDALVKVFTDKGYHFISLEEALRDPAYRYPDKYIPTSDWLGLWAFSQGKTFNAPSPPEYIRKAYETQSAQTLPSPVEMTAQQDHQLMMQRLGITSLRPGADPNNPNAANAVNYDESKANPYPTLPDPLLLKNGKRVMTAEDWWKLRRPEIVEEFDREIYGRVPTNTPKVNWEVVKTTQEKNGEFDVITRKLVGHVDNSSYPAIKVDIDLTLTTPANATGPVPVMMEFGFIFPPGFRLPANLPPPPPGPSWQQQLLARGWGYAILIPNSYQADNGAGLTKGIIGLCNKGQPRKPEDWGTLRAWAWGASRALDYLETDKAVDAKQVGIEGLSRYGKAALVAMAYDQRFAIGLIGSSGEGGAKLHRRNFGELVENLAGAGEYHWMAGNFMKYAGPLTWNDLPVDAHELIALCAPRPTFISYGASDGSGAEGKWVDQKGSFMAAVAAGPVYRLLGKKDLGTTQFPPIETALIDGELAFRQHRGGHTVGPNWPIFIQFASRYIKSKGILSKASVLPL